MTDKVESEMSDLEFYDGPLESCKYDDKLYGLPLNANNLVLVYNDDMLQEAGYTEPPKTWDELREYAKKLTTDSTYGFAINAIDDEGSTYSFMPFYMKQELIGILLTKVQIKQWDFIRING